jgi:hypothetical protein
MSSDADSVEISLHPDTLAFLAERSRSRQRASQAGQQARQAEASAPPLDAAEHVRAWFREGLGLNARRGDENDEKGENVEDVETVENRSANDDIAISVTELACADPGCPIREVLVIVMSTPVRQWVIGKPLTYIRRYDVQMALQRRDGDDLRRPLHSSLP